MRWAISASVKVRTDGPASPKRRGRPWSHSLPTSTNRAATLRIIALPSSAPLSTYTSHPTSHAIYKYTRHSLSKLQLQSGYSPQPHSRPPSGADRSDPRFLDPKMSTWYSNILTTTTSRISNLQRTLLSSDADGDTEDDTHVCRVLRNYYTEKGRPFPPWLPPDPKAPAPVAPVFGAGQVGSRYGAMNMQGGGATAGQQSSGNALSSLWDSGGGAQSSPAGPASLRSGRTGGITGGSSRNPFAAAAGQQAGAGGAAQARPLPSQRGSYESAGSYGRDGPSPPPGSSGSSAQERLRQKLWGGGSRTGSPPVQQTQVQNRYAGGGAAAAGGGSGGGRTDDYEERFAPGGMYDASGASAGRAGGGSRPFMAANSPWANNEQDYSGGGRPAGGLPSGPRRTGLPSGPRMGR